MHVRLPPPLSFTLALVSSLRVASGRELVGIWVMSSPGCRGIPSNRRCGNCMLSYSPRGPLFGPAADVAGARAAPAIALPFCLSSVRAACPGILGLTFYVHWVKCDDANTTRPPRVPARAQRRRIRRSGCMTEGLGIGLCRKTRSRITPAAPRVTPIPCRAQSQRSRCPCTTPLSHQTAPPAQIGTLAAPPPLVGLHPCRRAARADPSSFAFCAPPLPSSWCRRGPAVNPVGSACCAPRHLQTDVI